MIQIETYLQGFLKLLQEEFGPRLVYMGLQGSYLRGEARESSDIDVMTVLDTLTVEDLDRYRSVVHRAGHSELACGFLCGREELAAWNPMEICHLVHTTRDEYGELTPLVPAYTRQDLQNYMKMGLNNLYHEICHRRIYEDNTANEQALPAIYKSVFFLLQNIHFYETGVFAATKRDLLERLTGDDRDILQRAMELGDGQKCSLETDFSRLFGWCQKAMGRI